MTKRPNMCHIFEKDMTQGCQIWWWWMNQWCILKGDTSQVMHRFWCRIRIVYSGLVCIFSLYLSIVPPFYVILGLQIYYLYIHKNMYLYVYKICICASTSLCICMTTKTLLQNRSLVFTYPSWPPNYDFAEGNDHPSFLWFSSHHTLSRLPMQFMSRHLYLHLYLYPLFCIWCLMKTVFF